MRKSKPLNRDIKKHPAVQRDAMNDMREAGPAHLEYNGTTYSQPNRDRAVGSADRSGRHFDAETESGDSNQESEE